MDTAPTQVATQPWQDVSRPVADRVELLLGAMTLEEKLAQLGSRWLRKDLHEGEAEAVFASDHNVAPMQDVFSAGNQPLDQASRHGLGHLTRVYGSAPVTAAEGAAELVREHHVVLDAHRLRIPALVHEECLTGFTTYGATVYPAAIAWAATFSPDLVERMAAAIGRDMAAVGVHQGLSPVLDVVRDYRWGRVEETMGEDPYLVSMLGAAYVRGLQSAGVIATLKHFAGYSASRGARNHGPVSMGRRELIDVILPPFETAVATAAAGSVMNSYADVDGVPAGADRWLLTEVLRDAWGFTGTVVSDYWAVPFLATMHRIAADDAEAGALALAAGIDVELPDTIGYGTGLLEKIRAGEVPEELVDQAARRLLTQKVALGLLDPEWTPEGSVAGAGTVELDSAANRALAREIAERSDRAARPRQRAAAARRPDASPWSARAPPSHVRSWAATPSPTTCCPATRGSASASTCRPRSTRCAPNCPMWTSPTRRVARSRATTGPASRPRSRRPAPPTCAWRSSATSPGSSRTAHPARVATRPTCGCPACRRT